jgi:Uma2 family endonuclease
MAAKTAPKRATYQDVLDAPPGVIAEVIAGVLRTQPRPAARHATAASVLGEELGPPFPRGRGGPGGWVILDEPELHLGSEPDIVVPDLAGWWRQRMPEVPDAAFLTLAPDWVCEVLSPSTAAVDRAEKMPVYAREHVRHLWLVDPTAKTLEVFRLEGTSYLLAHVWRDETRVRAEPFDAIELELGLLWNG